MSALMRSSPSRATRDTSPKTCQAKMSENASSSYLNLTYSCGTSKTEKLFSTTFMATKCFAVVPLSIVILCLGYQRWRRFSKASHSDLFTYNAAALQLFFGWATIFYFCGLYTGLTGVLLVGVYAAALVFPGEIMLHILTCVDRYVAVVHPIIYRGLTHSGGIMIRNISIVCVWLLCFGWVGVFAHLYPEMPFIAYFCFMSISLTIISFCSVSVLYVLVHPGPGKTERADKSKRKAFLTIMAILGALLIYIVAVIIALVVKNLNLFSDHVGCLILTFSQCFSVPCSLVLPLLFLRKAKQLSCRH